MGTDVVKLEIEYFVLLFSHFCRLLRDPKLSYLIVLINLILIVSTMVLSVRSGCVVQHRNPILVWIWVCGCGKDLRAVAVP